MRLLHIADVHAGVLTHSVPDPVSGLPSALVSTLRCLEAAVDIALETKSDAVIIAGDLYHGPNPPAAAIVGVEEQIARLRGERVPTLLFPGNHDRAPHPGQRSIVNVHAGGTVQVVDDIPRIVGLAGVPVGVLPSISRQRFASGRSREEAEAALVDDLERTLGSWAEAEPYPDEGYSAVPYIVTGHYPVAGSLLGGEVDIAIVDEPMLSPADLEGPWRYAAMGHIHRSQAISSSGKVVGAYSGALDRSNFGEETYEPVAWGVTLSEEGFDSVFHEFPMPARAFRTVDLNETTKENAIDLAEADIRAANEGAVVRIVGRFPEGDLYARQLELAREQARALQDSGATLVRIELEQVRPDRVRVADISKAPTESEALELWLEANEITGEDAEELRQEARRLLEEVNR